MWLFQVLQLDLMHNSQDTLAEELLNSKEVDKKEEKKSRIKMNDEDSLPL